MEDSAGSVANQLSQNLPWEQANTKWASALNPLLINPMNQMQIIENVTLISGVTTLNHSLGRNMQGWTLVDIQGAATVYRSQPFNPLTLTLTSSAKVLVSVGVF